MSDNCLIVIPIYKDYLFDYEELSLKQCVKIFKDKYKIVFIQPNIDTINVEKILKQYNIDLEYEYHYDILYFHERFFYSRDSYNTLLLISNIYDLLRSVINNVKYMLLYELDGFVFYDNLEYWINKNYDFIGSFSFAYLDFYNTTNKNVFHMCGGVSLRNIDYCIDTIKYIKQDKGWMIDSNCWEDMLLTFYSPKINAPQPAETFDFCWSHRYFTSYILNNFRLPVFLHYYQLNHYFYNICKQKYNIIFFP